MAPFFQKFKLHHLVLFVIVISIVLLRLRLLDVPLERDEGEYAYMGQLILQGTPPYQAAYNMKFPGIYFLYATVMAIFGQTPVAIHAGLLIATIASVLLLYLLGKNIHDEWVGVIAAASYAILSVSYHIEGLWANAEHFVLPFALAGLLLVRKAQGADNPKMLFLSGLAFGLAALTKQHGAFYALFGFTYLAYQLYQQNNLGRRRILKTFLMFISGVGLPLFIAVLYLYHTGVFDKFFFWAFTYAPEYISRHSLSDAQKYFFNNLLPLIKSTKLLWLLAAMGFLAVLFSHHYKRERFFLICFGAMAFLATTPFIPSCRRSFYRHGLIIPFLLVFILAKQKRKACSAYGVYHHRSYLSFGFARRCAVYIFS
ncbi:MAG: glycosyltransferase family 39 protein [Ignavibacteriales bacterium]|nr:glycosyltransferase family 39 protein [Ignavibacteriales bacterium]